MEDQIVGWQAAVREALESVEKASAASQAIAAKVIAKHLKVSSKNLQDVIDQIYQDAGLAGAKEAIDDIKANGLEASTGGLASAVNGVNWDTWTPGNPETAKIVRGSRLWDLMSAAGANSIGVTTTNRIGTILANGIEAGSTYKEMGDQINALLKDRTRSDIVAITETNRAFQAAALDEYQQAGANLFIWLAYAGACEKCLEREGPNFLSTSYPPAHPNCRCGTKAYFGDTSTAATAPQPSWVDANMTAPAAPESSVIVNATPTSLPKPKKPKTTPKPKPNEVAEQPVHAPEAHPTITEPAITEPTFTEPAATAPANPLQRFYNLEPAPAPENPTFTQYTGDLRQDYERVNNPILNHALDELNSLGPTTSATTEEIDQLINEGWLPIYRGVMSRGRMGVRATTMHANYRTAPAKDVFIGRGIFGHGQYASTKFSTALDYMGLSTRDWFRWIRAGAEDNARAALLQTEPSMQRMVVNPKARWLNINSCDYAETTNYPPEVQAWIDQLVGKEGGYPDGNTKLSIWARAQGYDGIRVTERGHGGANETYYNILNRTAVIFEEQPMTPEQLIARSYGGDLEKLAAEDKAMSERSLNYGAGKIKPKGRGGKK